MRMSDQRLKEDIREKRIIEIFPHEPFNKATLTRTTKSSRLILLTFVIQTQKLNT